MIERFLWATGVGVVQTAALFVICVAVEHVAVIERHSMRSRIPGAVFQIIGFVGGGVIAWLLQQAWKAWGFGGLVVPLYDWLKPLPLGGALYVLALVTIADFLTYWKHRAEHKWFWPIHVVHHSPHELHAINDIGHPLQTIPNVLFVWLPMSLVQMSGPGMPLAVGMLVVLLTLYIHSPIDIHFGPLRRILVDNRFHRIHHSLEPRHFEKNFSVGFSLWDWAFGTAYWPAKGEWPKVGVDGIVPPSTIGSFLMLPADVFRSRNQVVRSRAPAKAAEVNAGNPANSV